jgi:RHS repeat-associated protein
VVSVTFDTQGRRQRLDRVGAYTTYGYDDPGRLATLSDDQAGTATDLTSTFSYNAASQMTGRLRNNDAYVYGGDVSLTRQYTVNGLNQYLTAGPASFGYDANGNLTSDGSVTFGYDTENRLISASGSKTAALRYDPMGRLYETVGTVNGGTVTTRFLYDGDELVAEYDSAGNMLKRYVHGPSDDDPLLWYEGASLETRKQIFTDHQGSVVSIADGSGSNIAINTYDEWGVPGANTGRFQYTGQAWIAELGMYYYKARFYSPTLGRFMQTDPIGYKDQVNLYMYVGNDPVDGRDPTGLIDLNNLCGGARPVSGCKGVPDNAPVPTTAQERKDLRQGTEAGVNAYWESRCKRGDPVGCLAPNFASNGAPKGLGPAISRANLLAAIQAQHVIGYQYVALAKGEGRFDPIYDVAAVQKEYISVRWDLAWSNMWAIDHDQSGQVGILSPMQIANYQWSVFRKYGLPENTYGGSMFGKLSVGYLSGFYCNTNGGHCDAQ